MLVSLVCLETRNFLLLPKLSQVSELSGRGDRFGASAASQHPDLLREVKYEPVPIKLMAVAARRTIAHTAYFSQGAD